MLILREATAVDVLIGPFVDGTDGVTTEEALSPSVQLSKNGQTAATKNDVTTPTHDNAGYYNCELDATDTNTIGTLVLFVEGSTATHLQVRHEFQVVATEIYDALFASDADGFDANGDVGITNLTVAASTTLATGTHNPQTGDSYARLGAPAGASIAADILEIEGQTKIYTKNAAANDIPFMMVDSTDGTTPETGLSVTLTRSLDGAAFAAKDASTTVTELSNGWYIIDAAAADMNGDQIIFRATATGARDSYIVIRTRTT